MTRIVRAAPTALLLGLALGLAGCAAAPATTGTAGAAAPTVDPPRPEAEPMRAGPMVESAGVPSIEWGLVMHGGAGTITPESMTPELEREYRDVISQSLRAGHRVLHDGGSSLDAVIAAIVVLEDSPLFNSGRGAVFTAEGTNSLDASIMDGATLRAGAIAGVTRVKNPIRLAREVMDHSPHVMLSGPGAEEFAGLRGVELVDPSWFYTERRWQALQRAQQAEPQPEEGPGDDAAADDDATADADADAAVDDADHKFGTVGVIALDRQGRIAAGTSTGGMTNKRWGRIGDSPIIGAGTYADDRCGVSSTGWGEYFIRNVVAYDICARMRYKGISLERAAHEVIMERLEAQEPETGGIVSLDASGNIVMTFNTPGMYRGYVGADGRAETAIYR